jgi:hypothetical protein
VSDYRSVRVVSKPIAPTPRGRQRQSRGPNDQSYALIVSLLSLATTGIAFYDLYLLATNAG